VSKVSRFDPYVRAYPDPLWSREADCRLFAASVSVGIVPLLVKINHSYMLYALCVCAERAPSRHTRRTPHILGFLCSWPLHRPRSS